MTTRYLMIGSRFTQDISDRLIAGLCVNLPGKEFLRTCRNAVGAGAFEIQR